MGRSLETACLVLVDKKVPVGIRKYDSSTFQHPRTDLEGRQVPRLSHDESNWQTKQHIGNETRICQTPKIIVYCSLF